MSVADGQLVHPTFCGRAQHGPDCYMCASPMCWNAGIGGSSQVTELFMHANFRNRQHQCSTIVCKTPWGPIMPVLARQTIESGVEMRDTKIRGLSQPSRDRLIFPK